MLVTKTINNNIVTCTSSDGRELIAMGKGLGYDFRPGQMLDDRRIEKIFSIEETRGYENIKTVFSSVPEDLLDICIEIIDKARKDLSVKLNDNVYLTLTDHVNFAITKAAEGIYTHSAIATEVKVFYPGEYLIGKDALKAIKEKTGVDLPDEEACAIALHIVNAEFNTGISSVLRVTESIAAIISIISEHLGTEIRDDEVGSAAFIGFLKFFVFRAFTDNGIKDKANDRFALLVQELSSDLTRLSDRVSRKIEMASQRKLSRMGRAILSANIYFFCEYIRRK